MGEQGLAIVEDDPQEERKTLREWLQDPRFTKLFAEIHWEMLSGDIDRIQADYEIAVETLRDVAHKSPNHNARVAAAKAIMQMAHSTYDRFIDKVHMDNLQRETQELRQRLLEANAS